MGEPNKCIINVRNPKLINIHKRVIFKVIAFIPFQNASDKTPQPAIRTIHVLSNAILFTLSELSTKAWESLLSLAHVERDGTSYLIRTNCNMAHLRKVVRTSLFRNSILQASRLLGIRNLSVDVDDYVSGITDEQKQVGFPSTLQHQYGAFSGDAVCFLT